MPALGDFQATALDGRDIALDEYDGRVVLVVNTATQCGYASQMPGLQDLHNAYGNRGFSVLGFPSNQFKQEPRSDGEMAAVCERNYGVTFPIFGQIAVNGRGTHPLFKWLKLQKKGSVGGRINWNFTKFLVARDGTVVGRYSPTTEPDQIRGDIEQALAA